ncbi:DUF2254 domain-containing protein [Anabaena sp. FACHB-709]|uniref:DUF2254 domain-containing protein n=2 Tax=Nostocaceae TaxID=1162 RepID=A0A1Z4KPS3_ANAVA|nr:MULTISPECIES: DUF2254 domain-containing protein [Nostocaceae]BAY70918.1 hypothetical protein NIES23_37290 [Trichormus variabilis NIES-23]HBW31665.1 DUF2254 domain-containing protein [Nostoc sp. UBA8866]MBD2171320.1 DUF2254 domain-containing protein [Anabaena cylindrica FACHB-318]MBD2263010.1 DUF2254 domain-containing protein [Anabaena sp. FACHB-709]MBD2272647.1 DUF2254 domain-containing protein [Nostoc sp. PCC 7120 = FACHB-418]
MKNVKISKLWDQLHSSYWFIPAVMAVVATALAFTMLNLDRTDKVEIDYWWVYTGGADGARSLLEAVAGSMVSVAATAFSITIVALQLAAANFGPRLLRNFMQDTGNQVVLGTFLGTFVYCLFVLRTIRGEGDGYSQFVPQLAVTVGILLAIISIGILIYFIHHASTIIQASHVIQNVSADLHSAIKRLFPEKIGRGKPEDSLGVAEIPPPLEEEAVPIRANRTGYLQAIDNEELMKIACHYNLLIHLQIRPGKFVVQGSDLVLIFPGHKLHSKLTKKINNAFIIGKERTEQQDVEFPINQLVEIALRAISPGVNDPFTAIRCIDQLSTGFCHLVQRKFPSPYRYNHNQLRIIAEGVKFPGLMDTAFNQIRQYGRSDIAVIMRLLEAIALIATYTKNSQYQAALRHHADMILQDSCEVISQKQDRKDVEERYYRVIKNLENDSDIKNWKS